MNKPKRTSIHQILAEQKEAGTPKQPAAAQLLGAWENAKVVSEYLDTLVRKDFEEYEPTLEAGEEPTPGQLAERDARIKAILGGFDDADAPSPAPTPLSTCAIAPTETGHKITLQVESDADLHSLTAWLLESLESLPA